MSYELVLPKVVTVGQDTLETVGQRAACVGETAAIIVDERLAAGEWITTLTKSLSSSGVRPSLFIKSTGEPTVEEIDDLTGKIRGNEIVISLGGGSIIDTAKMAGVLQLNPGSSEEYQLQSRTLKEKGLYHIAIPTTSGSGSEGTKVAVITNKDKGIKRSIGHVLLVPDMVIIDPRLFVSLPAYLTALTGIDALSHAFESYVSIAANAITKAFALQAVKLIGQNLLQTVKDGKDLTAREGMAVASYLAGLSLNGGVGAMHILAQPISAVHGIGHAEAIALMILPVINYNQNFCSESYAELANVLGGGMVAEIISNLLVELGIKIHFKDFDIQPDIQAILESAEKSTFQIKSNPAPVDRNDLKVFLENAR